MPAVAEDQVVTRRIELALRMIELGAAVFPLSPGGKAPLIPKSRGGGGFLDAKTDPELARTFLSNAGHPNYGVVFPEGSDVITLDLDGGDRDARPGWQEDWHRQYERLGPPGLTYIVRTPSGGRHAYYRWRSDLYGPLPPGDELLGWTVRKPWKGYVVGPGSVVKGSTYEPVGIDAIADFPEPWSRAALAEKTPRHEDEIRVGGQTPGQVVVGHRHKYLRDQARHLVGVGLTGEALFTAVMDLNRQLADPKTADEVRDAIGDAETKFERDPIDPETGRPIVSAQRDGALGRKKERAPEVLDDLPFYAATEISAMTPEIIDWAWADYLAHGTILEIVGPPKAGKTTFVFGLVRAYVESLPFLDRRTTGGPVVVLTEQGPTSLRAVLERTGIADRDDVHLLMYRDTRGERWQDIAATAIARCGDYGARVLVVDTLPAFAGLAGDAENSAGDALEAMEPLLAASAAGLTVLVNRHRRKGNQMGGGLGDIADEGRGSGAFSGSVDVILSLRRVPGGGRPTVRELVAASRFDETPEKLFVELDDGRWLAVGDDAAIETAEGRSAVLEILEDGAALSFSELMKSTAKSRGTLQRVIDDLTRTGDIERSGQGRRHDPYRYRAFLPTLGRNVWAETEASGFLSAQTLTPYGGEVNEGPGREEHPGRAEAHVDCRSFADHQTRHYHATGGWVCPVCTPEDVIA